MKKFLVSIAILSLTAIPLAGAYAMEESLGEEHMSSSTEQKAEDMGMEKSEHEDAKSKAHMKYKDTLKKAESTYKKALAKAAKMKSPKKAMMQAKDTFKKAKKDAEMMYQKDKKTGMEGAKKKAAPKKNMMK